MTPESREALARSVPPSWPQDEGHRPLSWQSPAPVAAEIYSTRSWSVFAMVAISTVILTDLGAVGVEIVYYQHLQMLSRHSSVGIEKSVDTLENVLTSLAMVRLLCLVGAAAAFLTWSYRSYANLKALGAQGTTYSPGWAGVYYFIPILSLYRPYQVMMEIWRGSDPAYSPAEPFAWQRAAGSQIAGFWWAFWLISVIAGQFSMRASIRENATLDTVTSATVASIVSSATAVLAGICVIYLIHTITGRQEEKARAFSVHEPRMRDDY